ncbi:hypothetical protein EX30DRAFT_344831 [Ascodesmis nigricans]|uniref:Zn(2)-C6 fungal-type domain-containing protein n=1 Tax=Ascodesmis nigricans TaxID=341454 RepID=A0A4S2MI01_9PEZI|nr:hypothetical protein EX30DRAFT_344831 [Ascodesmis nigricans]
MAALLDASSPELSPTTTSSAHELPQLAEHFGLESPPRPRSNGQGQIRSGSVHSVVRSENGGEPGERAQSQGSESSNNINMQAGIGPASATIPNPRKRPSLDTVEYPRRRATIACEVCRSRKSRCDGTRPKCRLCVELNADCVYREPGIKLDAGDRLILEHLTRIENMLHNGAPTGFGNQSMPNAPTGFGNQSMPNALTGFGNQSMPNALTGFGNQSMPNALTGFGNQSMPNTPLTPLMPPQLSSSAGSTATTTTTAGNMSKSPSGLGSGIDLQHAMGLTTFSHMPKFHSTPALHLLRWPKISQLVSRPYSSHHLLQLELNRSPLQLDQNVSLDLSNSAVYVQAYFERVNTWYACVNPYSWTGYYSTALSQGFRAGPESCMVLLVLALGCASTRGSISRIPQDEDPPGLEFFSVAWGMLPALMTRQTIASAQCMILAAAYLFYLVRPLEAWSWVSAAATRLQLIISIGPPDLLPNPDRELCERVYWNAVLFESDLLAEMDLPHSGLVQLEDTVGLPGGFETTSPPPSPEIRDDLWYFLSEIALRRLLNRVSNLIYSRGTDTSIPSLAPVVAELEFQLNQWYSSLPLPIRFPHTRTPIPNPVQTVLRLRYYACRTIIFRPYILAVLENEALAADTVVRDNCRKCLDACLRQLEHITEHHAGHLPYLWQGALSMVSQSLLVMAATMCPPLAAILPMEEMMEGVFGRVVEEVERYAQLAPSLRLSAEILREAEARRQVYLRTRGLRV